MDAKAIKNEFLKDSIETLGKVSDEDLQYVNFKDILKVHDSVAEFVETINLCKKNNLTYGL